MPPRINSFTFERPEPTRFDRLFVGQHVQVQVVDLRERAEEPLWLEVCDDLGNGVYRAEPLDAARYFPELPRGDTVYLTAAQAQAVRNAADA
ncbi:hypothetical protein [Deinococcus ficus]|uniref:hypothetical protein n=1 Tax=Deinococcus ficus TaxID=317577 RepID=UPI00174B49D0|nr:hypothetical protein [Deinococcus ficus]GHF79890.1 hypothetical protein GCM10017782_17260 [Deinococcus ficus]